MLVEATDERLLITGDLLVHAIQLVDPDLAYAHEEDPATARASRTTLLRTLTAHGPALLATPTWAPPSSPSDPAPPHPGPGREPGGGGRGGNGGGARRRVPACPSVG